MTSFELGWQQWVEFCGQILNAWGHVEGRIELLNLQHSETSPEQLEHFRRTPFWKRLETLKKLECLRDDEPEKISTFKHERDNVLCHNLTTEGSLLRWYPDKREKIMRDAQEAMKVVDTAFYRHMGEISGRIPNGVATHLSRTKRQP